VIYPELLQDATNDMVKTLLGDSNWVWQEKHNGDRRLVEKSIASDGTVRVVDYNRSAGRGKGLSPNIVEALKRHPLHQFVIDCEYVGAEDKLYVFDALHLGDVNLVNERYRLRLESVHAFFDGFHKDIVPIESAFTPEQKVALYERLQKIFAEGFVMKDLNAPYRESRPSSNRWNYRYKFVKTLDAVVIGDTTERDDAGMLKNSVRVGLYMPNGFLKDICGVTKKSGYVLKPGDVVQIVYLYGTGNNIGERDVVQPRIDVRVKQPRYDKKPHECTIDQIVVNKNWRKKAP
jgi:ATP-dependent DNA ligase